MPTSEKGDKARITARVPADVQARLEEASALRGISLNSFIVQAALREANDVLAEESALNLSEMAVREIVKLLEKPPRLNAVAKRAKRLHKEFVGR